MTPMNKYKTVVISIFICALVSSLAFSQNGKISWYSLNMGYGQPTTGNTRIQSVAGQVILGTTQAGNTRIISGFLPGIVPRDTSDIPVLILFTSVER